MDAKTLLKTLQGYKGGWAIQGEDERSLILSALSLAADVEGPEEATPETDAKRLAYAQYKAGTSAGLSQPDGWTHARTMERQRNAALRARKP